MSKKDIPMGFYFDAGTPEKPKHDYYFDGKRMTGCTTILGVLNKHLEKWAAGMAVEYIADHIGELIGADQKTTAKILDDAKTAYATFRDKRASEGSGVHAIAEEWINTCIKKHGGKPLAPDVSEIQKFIDWAQKEDLRFLASEQKYYSKSLFIAGTADIVAEKDGKRYIMDIKNKKKIWSREPFFQMAGYALMSEEMGEPKVGGYCVIRLWENEIEPIWSFDIDGDKEGFRACVTLYRSLNNWGVSELELSILLKRERIWESFILSRYFLLALASALRSLMGLV